MSELLPKIVGFYFPFLFALCFHEYAHGWMAKRKGDNTAELMGRLTMNPIAHADPFGTVIFPIMGVMTGFVFGWAKPVPVNPSNLKNPKEDMFWIALAGPASNLLLAFIGTAGLVMMASQQLGDALMGGIYMFIMINMFLCFFNLIPLHPLDGGKILARFLPLEANRWLENNQTTLNIVLIGAMFLGGFRYLGSLVEGSMRLMLSIFL